VSELISRSAFHGILAPGRFGNAAGEPGVHVAERADLGLASIEMRKGQMEALTAAVRGAFGVALPTEPAIVSGPDVSFVGTGPGQWLAISERHANEHLAVSLAASLQGLASITDQSSGRGVLRLSGPRVRDVLAKGLPIDLDPRAFPAGSAATSTLSHMGVVVWRAHEADGFDIALFRSVAESFWRWLSASAAEYGYEVVTRS